MSDVITVRGFVATEVKSTTTTGGTAVSSFRLGATDRRFDRATQAWIDGSTNWFTVSTYRQLASNAACSIKKGQRVIVVGKLKIRQWEKDGKYFTSTEIDAESLGHDLMWGSANFVRSTQNSGGFQPIAVPEGHQTAADLESPWTDEEPPCDNDGVVREPVPDGASSEEDESGSSEEELEVAAF